jgi:hypothetical protein
VLQRHVEEHALDIRQRGVGAGDKPGLDQCCGPGVLRERPRLAAPELARKLVEQQDQCEQAARAGRPGIQRAGRGGFNMGSESTGEKLVTLPADLRRVIAAEPHPQAPGQISGPERIGAEPEIQDVLRPEFRHAVIRRGFPSCPAPPARAA